LREALRRLQSTIYWGSKSRKNLMGEAVHVRSPKAVREEGFRKLSDYKRWNRIVNLG